jgi:hypothetical protein
VKLRTPVATIGVRGTEFLVHVDGTDVTIIDIMAGAVEARPNGSGQPVVCVGGQSILIAGPDENAVCGDLGSFSAAVGSPGGDRRPEPGHGGQNHDRPQQKEKPEPEPDPDPDTENGGSQTMLFVDEEPFDLV